MPEDRYPLADLARLADVTPRTVRYYVAQGLLPAPASAGPATRYGEGHLARLRLIRRLQREHLPLAEIRGRLERLGDSEVAALVDAGRPADATTDTLEYVRDLMRRQGIEPSTARPATTAAGTASRLRRLSAVFEPATPEGFPGSPESRPPQPADPAPSPSPAPLAVPMLPAPSTPAPAPRPGPGDRTTWERVVLASDVELHIRRPLDRRTARRVDQLTRIARELFDEEP